MRESGALASSATRRVEGPRPPRTWPMTRRRPQLTTRPRAMPKRMRRMARSVAGGGGGGDGRGRVRELEGARVHGSGGGRAWLVVGLDRVGEERDLAQASLVRRDAEP